MEAAKLAWAQTQFKFEVEKFGDYKVKVFFRDAENGCLLDLEVYNLYGEKQLRHDINNFMLSLEEIL